MAERTWLRSLSVILLLSVSPAWLEALPHPEDPIDVSKRAPISTQGAVRPGATVPRGTGTVGNRHISPAPAAIAGVPLTVPRAPVAVTESRPKSVKKPNVRPTPASRTFPVSAASSLPASVPRLDPQRYRKILSRYRDGQTQAAALMQQHVRSDSKKVGLAEINRYADPRATIERQGIPVTAAGASTDPAPASTPVPVRRESSAAGR